MRIIKFLIVSLLSLFITSNDLCAQRIYNDAQRLGYKGHVKMVKQYSEGNGTESTYTFGRNGALQTINGENVSSYIKRKDAKLVAIEGFADFIYDEKGRIQWEVSQREIIQQYLYDENNDLKQMEIYQLADDGEYYLLSTIKNYTVTKDKHGNSLKTILTNPDREYTETIICTFEYWD